MITKPADQLIGLTLDGGWKVVAAAKRDPGATGGHFSNGYIAEGKDGTRAYVKALDYTSAFLSPDPARVLQALTEAYNHERDLCRACSNKSFDRVVRGIDEGKVFVDPNNPAGVVQYLIFELAEGDIRSHLDAAAQFDLAWTLRSLHHIATGMKQLHSVWIAHQDLKPSNVLQFPKHVSKVADLGRATAKGVVAPHESFEIAGDPCYAPPELLYGAIPTDWNERRFGCDLYLLGSMIVFLFTRTSMTALLLSVLPEELRRTKWGGSFADLLPHLQNAFTKSLHVIRPEVPPVVREEISAMIFQLCQPDPARRGHPLNAAGYRNRYSLERFVSILDRLAMSAEHNLFRS